MFLASDHHCCSDVSRSQKMVAKSCDYYPGNPSLLLVQKLYYVHVCTYRNMYLYIVIILIFQSFVVLAVIYTGRNPWEFRIDWREFSPLFLAREFEWVENLPVSGDSFFLWENFPVLFLQSWIWSQKNNEMHCKIEKNVNISHPIEFARQKQGWEFPPIYGEFPRIPPRVNDDLGHTSTQAEGLDAVVVDFKILDRAGWPF